MPTKVFLQPLDSIDPSFRLDPAVYTFDGSPWWNAATKRIGRGTN